LVIDRFHVNGDLFKFLKKGKINSLKTARRLGFKETKKFRYAGTQKSKRSLDKSSY